MDSGTLRVEPQLAGLIDVVGSGAVVLGPDATCDGFDQDRQVRIQSHIHSDHMADFSTSKSRDLIMSPAVRDLLCFDHPDFDFRANVHALCSGDTFKFGQSTISLQLAGHMLGAVQAIVVLDDGRRLGYSGDFFWPIQDPVQVDALVVDATYGAPSSDRGYDQQTADERLADLVRDRLKTGPIQLLGNSAVMERALLVISTSDVAADVPILGNAKLCASVDVHRRYGWPIAQLINVDGADGHRTVKEGKYIRCWRLAGGGRIDGCVEGSTISLTKFRAEEAVEAVGESSFRVGMSNHADFRGTIEYVGSTGVVSHAISPVIFRFVPPDRATDFSLCALW